MCPGITSCTRFSPGLHGCHLLKRRMVRLLRDAVRLCPPVLRWYLAHGRLLHCSTLQYTMYLAQGRRSCSRRDLSRKRCLCSQTNKESVSACSALQCNVAHPAFSSPDAWQKTSNNEKFGEKCVVQTTRSVYEKTIFSKNRKILQEGFLNENNGASRPILHTLICSCGRAFGSE